MRRDKIYKNSYRVVRYSHGKVTVWHWNYYPIPSKQKYIMVYVFDMDKAKEKWIKDLPVVDFKLNKKERSRLLDTPEEYACELLATVNDDETDELFFANENAQEQRTSIEPVLGY